MSVENGWFAELCVDLGIGSKELVENLKEFARNPANIDAFQKRTLPRDSTIANYRKDISSDPTPQSVAFILAFLAQQSDGMKTRYARWARKQLPAIQKTTQLRLTHRLEVEEYKRGKAIRDHKNHVAEKYIGSYFMCRVNSAKLALREYFIIREPLRKSKRSWYPKLEAIWINYKRVYTGDLLIFPTTFTAIMCSDDVFNLDHTMNFTISRDRWASKKYPNAPLTLAATYSGESSDRLGIYTAHCALIKTDMPSSISLNSGDPDFHSLQIDLMNSDKFHWPVDYYTGLRSSWVDTPTRLISTHAISMLAHGSGSDM